MEDDIKEVADFQSDFKDSRLLLVCKSCFSLKPPVIVELGNSSSCSWCSKEGDDLLLLGTKLSKNDDEVEYFVIRKRRSFLNSNSVQECKKNLGLNWKLCPDGDDCTNAHSKVEFRIWKLESGLKAERRSLVKKLNSSIASNYVHLKGVFHCIVCSKNFSTGKDFSDHCDLDSHKYMMRAQNSKGMLTWKYRPLPDGENFALCSLYSEGICPDQDHCRNAHSKQELMEWKYRLQLQQDKLKFSNESGLMSFTDQVLHEFSNSSSTATVMISSIPGVKVTTNFNKDQTIRKKMFAWTLKIRCNDNKEKLNHAAFISRHHKHLFQICRCRKKRKSKFVDHLDFKVMLNDNHSLNLHDGEATYMVKFKTDEYGFFSSSLILEFRNKPRPVLKIDFNVKVIDASFWELLKQADIFCEPQTLSWERDRTIIRLEKPFANDFDEVLKGLMTKYKPPDTALDFSNRQSSQLNVFDPNKMSAENYVEEMHQFLYREEKARSDKLCGVRPFVIALSDDYMSAKGGLCFSVVGCLFAIFELPRHLSRDAEDGLLIFENCNKVLIGRKNEPSEPVYEVSINEKFTDHVVLQLSENCVKDWKLKSGQTVDVEIQFQLDRERFCRCHCALDLLKNNNQLNLVCPDVESLKRANTPLYFAHNFLNQTLDEEQRRVLYFLTNNSRQGSLFVVQGSFGTGKTYTISECIKHLIESDKNARVLICTHSNSAAAIYIDNNFQDHNQWKDKVIRVVYHGRNPATLTQFERHYCLKENNQFRYPTAQDVASHKIFVTTFETALELGVYGTGLIGAFTHIFLDEVAQVMEAAAIIPLTLADTKTKVVIAGDHIQITEKIYSKANHIDDSQFTLLERMYLLYSKQSFHQLVVFRNNYRSIAPILNLIELLFYRKGLLRPCSRITPLRGLTPIQFYDVEGLCEKNVLSGGYYNLAEAQKVTDVVSSILKSHPEVQQDDIAVVAAYDDQISLMRRIFRARRLNNVYVSRVRNIQGREFKIVVLSCVHKRETRENKEGETFGLLSNRNLLNTAFTRTKLAIIAVGHALTLWSLGKCHIMWREYIRISEKYGALVSPFSVREIAQKSTLNNFSYLNPFAVEFVPNPKQAPNLKESTQKQQVNPHQEEEQEEEEVVEDLDESSIDEEETLPLKNDILDDIVKNVIGIDPEKLAIKIDATGKEFPVEQSDSVDRNDYPSYDNQAPYTDYSLDHLHEFLNTQPNEYKRCVIKMINWHSATAEVLDENSDFQQVIINSRTYLGRSFNLDEVVVRVTEKGRERVQDESEASDTSDKLIAYGKVVGILSRYKVPEDTKYVCFPDKFNSAFMCPVDKKTTKFLIQGRRRKNDERHSIPIFKMNKKGELEKNPTYVEYDKHAITLEKSRHFVVRFVKWPATSKYPIGYVSEIISPKDFVKYYSIVHDVPASHPNLVNMEAENLVNNPVDKNIRHDLSDLFVFTIDPEGSTDLDDALSLNRCSDHDDCWKIGIHIADVASVVPADSEIDSEARKRSTSFYCGDCRKGKARKVVHMLPSLLSSDKCSLRADGEKRSTITMFLHSSRLPVISKNQVQVENLPKPILSCVTSSRQLTYLQAETCLREVRRNGLDESKLDFGSNADNIGEQLFIIWQTMLKLRFKRIEFSSFFAQPEFDGFLQFCNEASAHMLIEEAMITYNACSSHYLYTKGQDFLLRTQIQPSTDSCIEWKDKHSESIVRSLRQQFYLKAILDDNALNELEMQPFELKTIPIIPYVWEKIGDALNSGDLDTALILFSSDVLQPAVCSSNNSFFAIQSKADMQTKNELFSTCHPGVITHFSLRLPLYSWFSSPIRRYCDLQSQRLIIRLCSEKKKKKDSNVLEISTHRNVSLKELAKRINQRNQDAKGFEKDTQNFSFALLMSKHQNYEVACVKAFEEGGALLNFVDFRDLPFKSCFLRFSELKLSSQEESTITWRLKYHDLNLENRSYEARISFNTVTGTEVLLSEWNMLLRSIKASILNSDLLDSRQQSCSRIKQNFKTVLKSQKTKSSCSHSPGFGPCIHENCSKSNKCRDHLDGFSRLKISHYRKITMPLVFGTPLLVQMHCGVRLGICTPSVQLLSVGEDLDICLAHNSSPIETFAAEVRPISKSQFRFLTHYTSFWIPLSRMEGIYNSVQDNSHCMILQNVVVTFDRFNNDVFGEFLLGRQFCQKRVIEISPDDFLCIRVKCFPLSLNSKNDKDAKSVSHKKTYSWVLHAVVESTARDSQDFQSKKIKFRSCSPLVGKVNLPQAVLAKEMKAKATVEVIQLGITHRATANALRDIEMPANSSSPAQINRKIVEDLCLDKLVSSLRSDDIESIIQSVGTAIVPGMKFLLNQSQIEQIQKALRQRISMIQGPPGTGKSFVGAHLAYYFHLCNQLSGGKRKKILYCGPSNKAVDVVAEYLLDSKMKVLRVYGKTFEEEDFPNPLKPKSTQRDVEKRPSQRIAGISLHRKIRMSGNPYAAKITEFDKKFGNVNSDVLLEDCISYKENIIKAKLHEILNHDVIICTCATASVLKKSLTKPGTKKSAKEALRFFQCIIDECGMCSEPETLGPISASEAQQVVLIGDHQQLQPIILSRRAVDFGMGVSMFERLKERAGMLTIQYRMDEKICEYPSERFYYSELLTDVSVYEREKKRTFRFCHPQDSSNTAVLCHVVGTEKANFSLNRGGESSYYNEDEAEAVIKVLVYFVRNQVPLKDIAILSPYTAQVTTIRNMIFKQRSHLKDVHVGTVVTSQGSERDFVILSTVRSRSDAMIEKQASNIYWRRKYIGFVSDPHQINVAITRAKSGLCIVGNSKILEKDTETWKGLIDSYRERGSLVYVDDPKAPWNQIH